MIRAGIWHVADKLDQRRISNARDYKRYTDPDKFNLTDVILWVKTTL